MTTIQSIPHAFSSASNVTVSPFQQGPNKYFFVSSTRYLAEIRKQITKLKELAMNFKKKKEIHNYKQSHVRGRKDGDLQ